MKSPTLVLVLVLALAPSAFADLAQDANAAYQAKQWPQVITIYQQIAANQPNNGQAWYRLGRGFEESGKTDDAISAFKKAVSTGSGLPAIFANLRMAAIYTSSGRDEEGLNILQTMADAGFSMPDQITDEPKLASLKSRGRFQTILEQIKVNAAPCTNPKMPEYRQFDFWIGEWNVFDQANNQVGTSSVQLILKDCVIFENWTGGMGSQGKSFNKYNPELKQWEQYWVDEGPARQFFTGHFADKAMHFVSDPFTPDGKPLKRRLTFFNLVRGSYGSFQKARPMVEKLTPQSTISSIARNHKRQHGAVCSENDAAAPLRD